MPTDPDKTIIRVKQSYAIIDGPYRELQLYVTDVSKADGIAFGNLWTHRAEELHHLPAELPKNLEVPLKFLACFRLDMPDSRFLAALKRVRESIAGGIELLSDDDCTIGSKSTECSWGMCCKTPEVWADHDDHLFPDDHITDGRISTKYRTVGQHCPFDVDQSMERAASGCFFRCLVFMPTMPNNGIKASQRIRALAMYDKAIAFWEDYLANN